ncbi:MAG: thioredoxin family protein [Bdellovibrio sp.]|nr:thioredoxin family protein [Bdellovibrio sp.]
MFLPMLFFIFIALPDAGHASLPEGIDWYKHDTKAAFEHARKSSQPLFLYWGAVWCPPCNQIKKTIFSSPKFQQAIKAFIPVYLDGDAPDAQKWGAKLKTAGYPTMLIMNGQMQEIMRLPTGVTVDEYVRLMQDALETMRPMKEILALALQGKRKQKATNADWERLAGYSWSQDEERTIADKDKLKTFEKLWKKSVNLNPIIHSRFFLLYLLTQAELEKEKHKNEPKKKKKDVKFTLPSQKIVQEFVALLKSSELYLANLETVNWQSKEIMEYLFPVESESRQEAKKLWRETAFRTIENAQLSLDERLSSLAPLLTVDESSDMGQLIIEKARWADQTAQGVYERQAVMSTAIYLLRESKQYDEAVRLAQSELAKSNSPFYFMSELSGIAKDRGYKKESIDWSRKAWEAATGDNTRFQWGTAHILNVLDLTPEDATGIETALTQVVREVLPKPDAFAGRNLKRFERLSKKIGAWGNETPRAVAHKKIKLTLLPFCQQAKNKSQCEKWVRSI